MFCHLTILDSVIIDVSSIQMSLTSMILLTLKSVSYFDLYLEIDNGERLKAKLNDKRDEFTFPIITFPFISSNIPASTAYGVYISQHMCYSRTCNVFDRAHLLTQQVLKQGDAWHYTIHIPLSSSFVYVTSIASHLTLIILRNNQLINKTRRMSLPGHLGSTPNYCLIQSLVFCIVYVCHCLSFFFLAIVLSDLLQFTASDDLLGIFKLVLQDPKRGIMIKLYLNTMKIK